MRDEQAVVVSETVNSDRLGGAPAQREVRGARTAFADMTSVSAARVGSLIMSLVSVTLVTHLLVPRQYSILAYLGVISSLMFTITSSWLSTGVTRYGREELELAGSVRRTSWGRIAIGFPLIVLAAGLVAALKVMHALPADLGWPLVLIAIGSGISLIAADHIVTLLEATGRMKLTAIALALQKLLSIAGIAAVVLAGAAHSAEAIALVWLVAGTCFAVVLSRTVWRIGLWPLSLDRAWTLRLGRFSLPMIGFAVSQYIVAAVDVAILGLYRSPRDVGHYALAYRGYGVLQQLATTATIVLSPLFVSLQLASRERAITRFYERLIPQALLVLSLVGGLVAPLLSVCVPILFGHRYSASATPLAVLVLAWILFSAASFLAPVVVLHERSRAIAVINALAAAVNLIGDVVLVGFLGAGIWAPAAATTASVAVVAIGYLIVAARALEHRVIVPVLPLLPASAAVTCAVVLHGAVAIAAGIGAALVSTWVAQAAGHVFRASDAKLIERLNIPGPGRTWAVRFVQRLG